MNLVILKRIFKYILGFAILSFILIVCNFLSKHFHLILPAPIMGIILLFLMLQFKIIKEEWVKDICELLLQYMPLLFIPFLVGIVSYYGLIKTQLLPLLGNIIICAFFTLISTALIVENIIKYTRLEKMRIHKDE